MSGTPGSVLDTGIGSRETRTAVIVRGALGLPVALADPGSVVTDPDSDPHRVAALKGKPLSILGGLVPSGRARLGGRLRGIPFIPLTYGSRKEDLMKSRCVKLMLVPVLLGLWLAFVAGSAAARPNMLDFQVIGTGTAGGTCQVGALAPSCTSNSSGEAIGVHIGFGMYTVSLTAGTSAAMNTTGGSCLPANTLGDEITAANGDKIFFKSVGWLCEEGVPGVVGLSRAVAAPPSVLRHEPQRPTLISKRDR